MVSLIFIRTSVIILSLCTALAVLAGGLVFIPGSPLPDTWNPRKPLVVTAPHNLLTPSKLRFAISDFHSCQQALKDLGVKFKTLPDKKVSEQCHILDQVQITQLSRAKVSPLKTTCGTALRLAMWEYHAVQPAALETLGQPVAKVSQIGSYNCRAIRSVNGPTNRMSEHATANAVDISGFQLADGKRISLLKNWNGSEEEQSFMREIRNGGCGYFRITLSPEYNALHADHFHFDQGRWTTCN
jgi:hypothetical protein